MLLQTTGTPITMDTVMYFVIVIIYYYYYYMIIYLPLPDIQGHVFIWDSVRIQENIQTQSFGTTETKTLILKLKRGHGVRAKELHAHYQKAGFPEGGCRGAVSPGVVTRAPMGKPPAMPFAMVTMSGITSWPWNPQKWVPVLPNPVWTWWFVRLKVL